MNKGTECVRKILEDHGIPYTCQRGEILSLFIAEPKHYKPNEVFRLLKDKGIGIATVYRTLEILRECGIIIEISVGRDVFYRMKKPESNCIYAHFLCDVCGKIYDCLDSGAAKKCSDFFDLLENSMDMTIKDVNITIKGLCNECKNKEGG